MGNKQGITGKFIWAVILLLSVAAFFFLGRGVTNTTTVVEQPSGPYGSPDVRIEFNGVEGDLIDSDVLHGEQNGVIIGEEAGELIILTGMNALGFDQFNDNLPGSIELEQYSLDVHINNHIRIATGFAITENMNNVLVYVSSNGLSDADYGFASGGSSYTIRNRRYHLTLSDVGNAIEEFTDNTVSR